MSQINVSLPVPRTFIGSLTFVDSSGNTLAGPFAALGKAANNTAAAKGNPTADSVLAYGDTPSGGYSFGGIIATGDATNHPAHNYGSSGAIVLVPVSGDAATAKANGRSGLLIHGGDPDGAGQLRRTNGCIRLANEEMSALVASINNSSAADVVAMIVVKDSELLATASGASDDVDEGDPPAMA